MDNISELLLGPQRATGSLSGVVLAMIAAALALALMIYLLRCYVQEAVFRKRVKRRVHQQCGGNVAPAEAMPGAGVISDTRQLAKKSSRVLPPPHRANANIKVRRHSVHPWKQTRFAAGTATRH